MNVIVSNRYAAMLSNLNIDLIKSINGEFDVDSLIAQFTNFFFNKMILDITAIRNYEDLSQIQRLSFGLDMSKVILLLDDSPVVNSPQYLSGLISMGIYNFTREVGLIKNLIDNPNTYKDVAPQFQMLNSSNNMNVSMPNNNQRGPVTDDYINDNFMAPKLNGTRIIGFKNLTHHAGATSLIYMLKRQLSTNYSVLGLELDKNDFAFFNDPDMKSISGRELNSIINNPINNYNIILVDVNNSPEVDITEMLYLIEPSTLKLNKMMKMDRNILSKIKGKHVILNLSLLNSNDVRQFESEAGCSVFHNIPPLNDKKESHRALDELANKLGLSTAGSSAKERKAPKLFDIVKE